MKEWITEGICRICFPFEGVYTTSFILVNNGKIIVADTGYNKEDVEQYILPVLRSMGPKPDYIVCSHLHGDHAGGLEALLEACPNAMAGIFSEELQGVRYHHFEDGEVLLDRYKILALPGHSEDSLGILDLKTEVLLTFDSLQRFGLVDYGVGVRDCKAYLKSVQKVRELQPKEIVASHDFLYDGYRAVGSEEVEKFLADCEAAVKK